MSCRPPYPRPISTGRRIAYLIVAFVVMVLLLLVVGCFLLFVAAYSWALIKGNGLAAQVYEAVDRWFLPWAGAFGLMVILTAVLPKE